MICCENHTSRRIGENRRRRTLGPTVGSNRQQEAAGGGCRNAHSQNYNHFRAKRAYIQHNIRSATTKTSKHALPSYLLYIHVCATQCACGRVILLHKNHVLCCFNAKRITILRTRVSAVSDCSEGGMTTPWSGASLASLKGSSIAIGVKVLSR
jgi:hypothetical protein